MNILYLCPDLGIPVLGRKGASVHVRELVAAFGRSGHSVVVATPQLNKSPWEEPAGIEASLMHVPPGPEAVAAVLALKTFNETLGIDNSLPGELRRILHDQEWGLRLKRRFDNHRPDFIYERASLYATAGVYLARELERPLILELNSPLAVEQTTYRATGLGELAAQAERWTLARADAVLTVSEPLRDYAVSLGADPDRVQVVPNGVDAGRFYPGDPDPKTRERWGLGDGPILGFVGGLRPWHGVEKLPALLERLIPDYPDAQLVIVGDGPLRRDLERDVRERDLTAVFTGSLAHEEVAPLVREFDLALAPYPLPD
ncbi:MAG: glycosyltransferase, partial [Rubrobacter sp.]